MEESTQNRTVNTEITKYSSAKDGGKRSTALTNNYFVGKKNCIKLRVKNICERVTVIVRSTHASLYHYTTIE